MIQYKRGDVVLVEVVFSEGEGSKKRPALIVSSGDYHKGRQEVIIAAITSNIKRVFFGDTVIEGWDAAGLLYPSLAAGIIQTIKARLIARKLGTLLKQDFQKVERNLKGSMGF